jgi:hypothetical protein
MNKWFKVGALGILVLGALALVVSGAAFAQEETPTPETETGAVPFFGRHGFGRGLGSEVALEAAAGALGMTADELQTQLWGGMTLAGLAEKAGVDLADVQAAVEAAQEQATRDQIAQAVEDGTLTQAHADWLLEGLDNGYWSGFGHGGHKGFGHGPRGFNFSPEAPSTAPSTDTDA